MFYTYIIFFSFPLWLNTSTCSMGSPTQPQTHPPTHTHPRTHNTLTHTRTPTHTKCWLFRCWSIWATSFLCAQERNSSFHFELNPPEVTDVKLVWSHMLSYNFEWEVMAWLHSLFNLSPLFKLWITISIFKVFFCSSHLSWLSFNITR